MASEETERLEDEIEEDEEFEDETLGERLLALTEMFPASLRNAVCKLGSSTVSGIGSTYRFSRSAMWIFSSSFMILVLPVVFEVEMTQMEQAQLQKERQIILGPNAAFSGGTGIPTGLAPAPMQSPPPPQPR
ncbi:mitochondrial import receptor subunit TOM22 homolog [Glandiceps talaboti]